MGEGNLHTLKQLNIHFKGKGAGENSFVHLFLLAEYRWKIINSRMRDTDVTITTPPFSVLFSA